MSELGGSHSQGAFHSGAPSNLEAMRVGGRITRRDSFGDRLPPSQAGAVSREHLDYYLDEYTFRFNRRRSRHRGKLFYRLVQQAAAVGPTTYSEMVQHVRGRRISRPQDMG